MSIPRMIKMKCPCCEAEFETRVFDSINTGWLNAAELVMSGELFSARCPECNSGIHLEYPIVYNDLKRRTYISLVISTSKSSDEEAKIKICQLLNRNGIEQIVVRDSNALAEKVTALEHNRDHRIIELLKFILTIRVWDSIPDYGSCRPFYCCDEGKEQIIFVKEDGSQPVQCLLSEDLYASLEKDFGEMLNIEAPCLEYDWDWAGDFLNRNGSEVLHCEC